MQRIAIIGSPGSGKSTLARELAARTGLPLVHLDQLYWQPGWVETDAELWTQRIATAIAERRWIIDGNYSGSLVQRLARADTVVLLDMPTWRCVWRILRRAVEQRGRVRPDMAPGCPERMEWEFFWYTVSFRRRVLPKTLARLAGFGGTLVRLRTPQDVSRFLDTAGRVTPAA